MSVRRLVCLPTLAASALVALGLFAAPVEAAQSREARRLAVVVGTNQGMPTEVELRYAENDALKVARALTDLGGYAQDDVKVVLGADAEGLRAALADVVAVTEAEPRSLVFFYYSGHADAADLHLSGTRLPLEEIRGFLDRARADVRVALVDACRSGSLIRAKGATLGPAFDIGLQQPQGVNGTIVITSSSEDEVAQESDLLGGSFFTHYWVSGLYGAADADKDGSVTLEEAYRFAHFQTVSQTISSAGGVQHPSYELDLHGEGAIVLASLAKSTARVEIRTHDEGGAYYILDADRRFLLTELAQPVQGRATVRLPPGTYRIKKREPNRFLVVDVTLKPGQVLELSDEDMESAALERGAAKGADAGVSAERPSPFALQRHGPQLLLGVRGTLLSSISPGPMLQAGYRFDWKYLFVEPRVGVFSGVLMNTPTIVHGELDFGAAVGARLPLGPFALAGGVDAGLIVPTQTSVAGLIGQRFWSNPSGLVPVSGQGRAFGELSWTWGDDLVFLGRAFGGLAVYQVGPLTVFPPTVGALLGASYAF